MNMILPHAAQAIDLQFKGNLIYDACTVNITDEALQVIMHTRSPADFYDDPRGPAKAFQIHLEDCDTSIADSVKVSFIGSESAELDGYLAINGESGSKGIAIGIENVMGTLIKLNDTAVVHQVVLNQGNTVIDLRAFLQAEPSALTNQSIALGSYSSTVTFMLDYQ